MYVYAWGLEAKYEISAAYVFLYHVLIAIIPFGLWGWWMRKHPNDLQGASVPATRVFVMVSLFWSASGILIQARQGSTSFAGH